LRVTTHYILRRGTTIHPHHYTLSLISLSVWVEDIMVTIHSPSIGVIVELDILTYPLYIVLHIMVVIYSLNTMVLNTMNLVRL
jgi:hypothetical protein